MRSTDNPNIFEKEDVILLEEIDGQPLASKIDFLKITIAEIGNISERRTGSCLLKRDIQHF